MQAIVSVIPRKKGRKKKKLYRNDISHHHPSKSHDYAAGAAVSFFLDADFFLVVTFLAAGLAAGFAGPLVTRPDLVLVSTVGLSTMAGAGAGSLRCFLALALGLGAAFLGAGLSAAAAFLGAGAFLEVVFFAVSFFAVSFLGTAFCLQSQHGAHRSRRGRHALVVVDLAAGSFLTSLTVPEGPLGWANSLASAPFLRAWLKRPSNRSLSTPL